MAEYEYIEKNDILKVLEKYEFDDKDIEEIYSDTTTSFIEYTKKLCQLYLKYLNLNTDSGDQAAYSLGAIIIFNLRKFITKKDIILYIGGTNVNNENLKTLEMPITELLTDLSAYRITDNGLYLESYIENYNNLNKKVSKQQATVWKRILDASKLTGEGQDFDASKADAVIPLKKGNESGKKERELYMRNKIDNYIYYGYSGNLIYSYYKIGDWYQYFNRGWLFEHFVEKWLKATSDEKEEIVSLSKGLHPLQIAIGKADNIPGYKGGDIQYKGKDYQIKYGNQRIISKNSIQEVMNKIIFELDKYKEGKKLVKKELANELVKLFAAEGNVFLKGVNDSYDDVVNRMTKSLTRRI